MKLYLVQRVFRVDNSSTLYSRTRRHGISDALDFRALAYPSLGSIFPDGAFAQGNGESLRETSGRVSLRGRQIVFEGRIDKTSVNEFDQLLSTSTLSVWEPQ